MNIKKRFSRCATVLAVAMTLGQTMIAPTQVLANGLETSSTEQVTDESTTQATTDSNQAEGLETTNDSEITESSDVSLPETIIGDKQEEWSVPYTQTDASGASAFTTDGDQIIFNQNFGMMTRGTGNSSGQLTQTYGAYSVSTPYITMSGDEGGVVWCINPDKGFPVNIEYAKQVYNDLGIYNILYYAEKNGWNQANTNYVDVFVALNIYLGHSIGGVNMNVPSVVNSPNIAFLLNKAQVKDAPTGNFDIKNKVQTADFDVASKLQVTDWYTPETTGSNVTYQIPTDLLPDGVGVELSNGTKYQAKTGSKTVNANVKFRLTAPASYTGKVKFDVDTNFRKQATLLFKPTSGNTQDLVKGGWAKDPARVTGIEATFFARLGNAKFKKISEISNLPLEGVTYKVTEEGKEPYEMKTDTNGELNFVDRLHGATIKVQEIANPIGYILDSTEYELTIEAAETVSKTLVNNVPRGKAKLNLKQQTVLDIEATKEKGEPVYKKVPLAGAKFNVVAVTNIMLPDGKTVLTKAGEVVDTITTDSKGYAETTKELFVGKANVYRLVEVNVPEGYRAPSEDQTLFTIPNGNNTEKLIVYDLGTIDNELQTGKLNFLKRDSLAFTGIEGATFTVEMMSGLYKGTYFTFQTKAEGNEFELPVGDYKITEIKLPNGFTFDESTPQTQWVTIKDNETIELNWNNKKLVPEVGISTQAHTGDGTSQTFTWGEGATFYDDSNLTHKDIPVGTKRAYETKLHAIYADGTQAVVWESGLVDYTVTDKEMTKRVIAEYDYRKDPKADEKTRWYFSEDGYNYDNEKPKKDTEHNPKGKDPKQQLTPVKKPVTPTTPTKPTTPQKAVGTFPQTGEKDSVASLLVGLMAIVAVIAFYVIKKRKETTVE